MDYRDERDALRGRVENLEEDLAEAKRELRAQRGEPQPDRGAAQPELGWTPKSWWAPILFGLAAIVVAITVWVRHSAPAPSSPRVPAEASMSAAATATDYYDDATAVPGILQAKIDGPVRLLTLSIYHDCVIAEIRDPRRLENFDRYVLRNGKVGDGDPVEVTHKSYKLEQLVDIRWLDFTAVPKMARDAVAQLKIEDGRVSSMIVTRGPGLDPAGSWHVYVQGSRRRGWVEYDRAGHLMAVHN